MSRRTWQIDFAEALDRWEGGRSLPSPGNSAAVLEAFLDWQERGPPVDAMPVPLDEDLYVTALAGVIVTFRVVTYERLVLVRSIEPFAR